MSIINENIICPFTIESGLFVYLLCGVKTMGIDSKAHKSKTKLNSSMQFVKSEMEWKIYKRY